MTAGTYNLTIEKGATTRRTITYRGPDDANGNPGTPIDITGWTARMQIRENVEDTSYILQLLSSDPTTQPHIDIHTPASGQFDIVITSDATTTLTIEAGFYDLELISSAGPPEEVIRLLEGTVLVKDEVTR